MKLNASVLAVASAISLATLAGLTVACSQSSVTPPEASTSASPIAAPANQPPSKSQSPESQSPSKPAIAPTTQATTQTKTQTKTQKLDTETTPSPAAAANRAVESCVVKMALVKDPQPPLNVRSAPTTAGDNVVGQLKNDTLLTIADDQNGWFQVKSPLKGWVSKQKTVYSCNQKVERLSLSADGTAVQIADRFIGTGNHRYLLPVSKGQTLTIDHDRGPFPMLIAPNGTVLLGHEKDDTRANWSGQLTQTGDYAIELESNFRGYHYAFSMQLK